MRWFKDNEARKEIEDLKHEIAVLRVEIAARTNIMVGDYPRHYGLYLEDPRPSITVAVAIKMLMDRMGLEIKQTPAIRSQTVIERKPKKKEGYICVP